MADPIHPQSLHRRALLGAGLLTLLPRPLRAEAPAASDGLAEVLAPGARVETLYEGGRWCEGPVWVKRLGGLVVSDVRSNRMLLVTESGTRTFREPSANANGNALDGEGRLITCEHRNRRVVREEPDGRLTVLAESFEGQPLNSPNDVVVARDGAVWFTDPTYGIDNPEEGITRSSEQRARFVFRLDPGGRLDAVADGFVQPNGLAFSPDGRVLYVGESSGSQNPGGRSEIRAFDVGDGGRLTRERVFSTVVDGVPDGLRIDAQGRVFAGTGSGARVWRPDGTPLGTIPTPGPCANIAFGGPDGRRLFLCAGPSVLAVNLKVRGAGFS
ncbi:MULTISPECIES: SMP-30/gluconolactonase/LRE family protein [Methylobacterium]|uniref:Gluconolactonase n=1 Tax=Methylobacterium thuringiense TaxID=1003091 RepID=A0ABQ4TFI3_9HYPH|nr:MULTISPECIES: SMP-30/gluconolactonase/LRE family protein [Methylobacterium]TXN23854.1 SMP-30/gluconolactonase/LRE family protein [Methylobacterium sp. WL9]GJE54145.1 Gluconolactonase [Methylobacterium thuringiense]